MASRYHCLLHIRMLAAFLGAVPMAFGAYRATAQSVASGDVAVVSQIEVTAGGGGTTPSTSTELAANARLTSPYGVTVDELGNLYIADTGNGLVEMLNPASGEVVVVAGGGSAIPNMSAQLSTTVKLGSPRGVAVDESGNLYIADQLDNVIEKVTGLSAGNPQIAIVAGGGDVVPSTTAELAANAKLSSPSAVAADESGNVYVADSGDGLVEMLNVVTGKIVLVAGGGNATPSATPEPATAALLNGPTGVAADESGDVYIADSGSGLIEKMNTATGTIVLLAGGGRSTPSTTPEPATDAALNNPAGVAADQFGNVYVADDGNGLIEKLDASTGNIVAVAGGGSSIPNTTPGPATGASLSDPTGAAIDKANNLFVALEGKSLIVKVSSNATLPTTAVGSTSVSESVQIQLEAATPISKISVQGGQNGLPEFVLGTVSGCAVDGTTINIAGSVCTLPITFSPIYPGERTGKLSVVDASNVVGTVGLYGTGQSPELVQLPGGLAVVAGGGATAPTTTPAAAATVQLHAPTVVALDGSGNLYLADQYSNEIEEVVASTGQLRVVAGGGNAIPSSIPTAATSAQLSNPSGVAIDAAGNIYIADQGHNLVEEVDASTGMIVAVAGGGGATPTATAQGALSVYIIPGDVIVDSVGNLYISDLGNDLVEKVVGLSTANPQITVIAGGGSANPGITAVAATGVAMSQPFGMAVDEAGNIYIADPGNNVVEKVYTATSEIVVVAGGGSTVPSTTAAAATSVSLSQPFGVAIDAAGNLYVSDTINNIVEKVDASTEMLAVVAGGGGALPSTSIEGATSVHLINPFGIAVDGAGNLYIADYNNNLIEMVGTNTEPLDFSDTNVGSTSSPKTITLANIGNRPAYISSLSEVTDFLLQPATSCTVTMSTGEALAPGSSCGLVYAFEPTTGGNLSEAAMQSDNTLNQANAQQAILLTGTASQPTTTATALTSSVTGTIRYGQGITLTASVTMATGPVTTGPVTFLENGIPIGTATVNANGKATFTTSSLELGSPSLTASYGGTADYSASTSTAITVTIAGALTVTANNATKVYGTANPTFTGTLTGAAGGNGFTESFSSTATSLSEVGNYTIVPDVVGANLADYAMTIIDGTLNIVQAGSVTALTVSTHSMEQSQSLELDATVASSTAGVPTGSVMFSNGNTSIGTAVLNANGKATLITKSLPPGTINFTATYAGDGNFIGSSSTAQQVTILGAAAPSFSVAASPSALTIHAGQMATTMLTLTPLGGFQGTVTLSCTNLPLNAVCGFTQNYVTNNVVQLNGNNQPVQVGMTIQTSVQLVQIRHNLNPLNVILSALAFWWPGSLVGLGVFRLRKNNGRKPNKQRVLKFCLLILGIAALGTAIWGCGGGPGFGPFVTPAGETTMTIQAAAVPAVGTAPDNQPLNLTITILQ